MILRMVEIIIIWIFLIIGLFGWGLGIYSLAGISTSKTLSRIDSWFSSIWLGFAASIAYLQIWHFWQPINSWSLVIWVTLGTIILLYHRQWIFKYLHKFNISRFIYLIVVAITTVWIANRAMTPLLDLDAAIYHLSVIKWSHSFPIVPGLGNLHDRLAFNNSSLLFFSLLENIWERNSYHLIAGLLLVITLSSIFISLFRIIINRRIDIPTLFQVIFLAPIIRLVFESSSTTSTDFPVFILGFVISTELCKLIYSNDLPEKLRNHIIVIILLSASIITTKISGIFLAISILFSALLWLSIRYTQEVKTIFKRTLFVGVILSTIMLAGWIARGYILSGYPFYPNTSFAIDVPWKVPEKEGLSQTKLIKTWARGQTSDQEILFGWDWVKPWASEILYNDKYLVVFPLLLFSIYFPISWLMQKSALVDLAFFLLPGIISFIIWFLLAPAPRFAGAVFWYLGAGTTSVVIGTFIEKKILPRYIYWAFILLIFSFIVITHMKINWLVPPGPDNGHYPLPEASLAEFYTDSGLRLMIPEGKRCFDYDLLCTPYPKKNLILIEQNTFSSGFRVEPVQ